MAHFAVSAVGQDQPGIVAALAAGLLELEGNVEDSRMTILRGHFAVMLIVAVPEGIGREALESRLEPVREELQLDALSVSGVSDLASAAANPTHVITVYGADHPGIVHAVSSELARLGVNITDLQTKLAGGKQAPLYVMLLEVELGSADAAPELEAALALVAEGADVDVSLAELEAEDL